LHRYKFRVAPLPDLQPAPAILFVTATRIGDAVLSTAVLRHILDRYDRPRLTIAAGPLAAPLFACVPGLERLITVTKRRHALHWLDLWREVGMGRRDLVIDLRGSGLAWLLRTRHRRVIGSGEPDRLWVAQLGAWLGAAPMPLPKLWWSAAHEAAARRYIPAEGPVLALGPATDWRGKEWPAARFAELVRRLTAPGAALARASVAIFATARERQRVAPVLAAAAAHGRSCEVIGEPDLLTVAAALARTSLFIGNDSGLMHMAAAVGVPTLGLFGPTSARRYAPAGPHCAWVQTDTPYEALAAGHVSEPATAPCLMETLSVDKVEAAAQSLIRSDVAAALPLG
jgi:ADP-heptose:LPS heptosyltransferase